MGLVYRKRQRLGRRTSLNISGGGSLPSISHRRGRVTANTRGQVSVRLLPGLSFRFRLWR